MRKGLFFILLAFCANTMFAQQIDASKSYVAFKIGNMVFNSVEGKITGMKGSVKFDEANLAAASFNVCVDPKTIDTGNEERDHHLKDADFFDVEKYPKLCFVSSSISKDGDNYTAKGKLTMYDTTKEISIPFTFENNTFESEFELSRYDYNLAKESYSSTVMVGETVEIKIVCAVK